MVFGARLSFVEQARDPRGFVTKFGGQPVWRASPKWPLSRRFGTKMRFVGQIAVKDASPVDAPPRWPPQQMAYLFMTDSLVDGVPVPETRSFDGGENAVILQPGHAFSGPLCAEAEGPSAVSRTITLGRSSPTSQPVIFTARLEPREDPEFVDEKRYLRMAATEWQEYGAAVLGSKLGGTPAFRAGDAFPYGDPTWRLLAQLRSLNAPFWLDFGYNGTGYVFVNRHLTSARFCWQE
ncbi:hypothetical protein B7R22_08860 [Subtercola boreus]|uniref:DUF1963 domain-containing protein n=1 Tax=Subtercola boreus TaxID=120213 RepID=A0A3E0VYJ8_9MICO|nr:DUF1963 domain-containing protein [Subtercola boreus]RFA14811.1 hypothetical protein B7R22_08860 [Subtercola boreus]